MPQLLLLGRLGGTQEAICSAVEIIIGLLEVARSFETNHPGVVVFDEPRQQAAAEISFSALLARVAHTGADGGQVLFATSEPPEPAQGRLGVNGRHGEWAAIPHPLRFLAPSGMDIGHNPLSPLSTRYQPPFPFQGLIHRVTFHLSLGQAEHTKPLDD